jgi:hypothetical protein
MYSVGYCAWNAGDTPLTGDWAIGTFQVNNGKVTYTRQPARPYRKPD